MSGAAAGFTKPPALVAFDVDGTLVDDTVFIWETLHRHFDTDPDARRAAREAYMAGQITYTEWFEHDMAALIGRGANRPRMMEAIAHMRPMAGAAETLRRLREADVPVAVISGSLSIVLDKLFPDEGFADVLISHMYFDPQGEITGWQPTRFDMAGKATGLLHLAAKRGLDVKRCAFVGDNFNDVDVVRAAGLGIAFNYKSDELAAVADVRIPGSDLRAVLPYLLPANGDGPGDADR